MKKRRGENKIVVMLKCGLPYLIVLVCMVGIRLVQSLLLGEAHINEFYIYLSIRIIIEYLTVSYIIFKFRRYFEKNRNNNVWGELFQRWDHESIIDKYHIRERFLGGSKLRIKREPKRYYIKYYWFLYIPAFVYLLLTYRLDNNVILIITLFIFSVFVSLIMNKMEKKPKKVITVIDIVLYMAITALYVIMQIGFLETFSFTAYSDIRGRFELLPIMVYIPLALIAIILIYSIIKKRAASIFSTLMLIIGNMCVIVFSELNNTSDFILLQLIAYFYVMCVILQTMYNDKALKKISFIK